MFFAAVSVVPPSPILMIAPAPAARILLICTLRSASSCLYCSTPTTSMPYRAATFSATLFCRFA